MKVLSKEEMASAQEIGPLAVAIPVPEWGEDCGLCAAKLNGRQREKLLKAIKETDLDYDVALKTIAAAACVSLEDQTLLFSDIAEIEAIIKDPDAVLRVGHEILKANKLVKSSLDDAQKN